MSVTIAKPGRGQDRDDGQTKQWTMVREEGQGEEGDDDVGLHCCCVERTTDRRPQRETVGPTGWTGREEQGVEASCAVLFTPATRP